LHRETRGLVEDDEVVVAVDHRALHHLDVARPRRDRWPWRRRGKIAQRRHADDLAGDNPIAGARALSVQANLARPQQLLEPAVAEAGEVPTEPAIEPDLAVIGGNGNGLNAAHGGAFSARWWFSLLQRSRSQALECWSGDPGPRRQPRG